MKVGDLVWCPALSSYPKQAAYFGLVIGVYGHKAQILGGEVTDWDGTRGRMTWDLCDIHLVNEAGNNESR